MLLDSTALARHVGVAAALACGTLVGCQGMNWKPGQIVPPAAPVETVAQYPMTGCEPCPPELIPGADPCAASPCPPGYVLVDPQVQYVPGIAPGYAPPPFPGSMPTPPAPGAAGATELPGWFDVLPQGSSAISPDFGLPAGPTVTNRLPNPLVVPVANPELAWDQLADVVSDYFPVGREQPVQVVDGVQMEGYIETPAQVGATLFEPHRGDSAGLFNRLESTFQTIRRRAYVRVVPDARGWAVETMVFKELEDLPRPEQSTASAATFRADTALPSSRLSDVNRVRDSDRWIRLGRDEVLEQRILSDLQERFAAQGAP